MARRPVRDGEGCDRGVEVAPGSGSAAAEVAGRHCGDCSLCCSVLRVDELRKLAGVSCVHQDQGAPGCAIHSQRPAICRAYRCLWLGGGLADGDRPDRLGAVLDVVASGPNVRLEIRQAEPGAYDGSPRLQAIAREHRVSMPVRISDVADVMNADRPYRVLLPGGEEHRVTGEWTEVTRDGSLLRRQRLGLLERQLRRGMLAFRRWRLRGSGAGPRSPLDGDG